MPNQDELVNNLGEVLSPVLLRTVEVYCNYGKKTFSDNSTLLSQTLNSQKEEAAELIVAISHYERGRISELQLLEEIIDTSINSLLLLIMLRYSKSSANLLTTTKTSKLANRLKKLLRRK